MDRAEIHDAARRRDSARLVQALRDTDGENRSLAAHYLGRLHSSEAVPALIESLDDPSEMGRMSVLRALGRIGDGRAIPRIAEVAETDPALGPASRATDVLARLGDPRAI